MSNSYGVNPTSGTGPTAALGGTYLSPEALLVFCQEQLGGLDNEIKTQMDSQQMQLRERTAVENVQSTLEQYGSAGPNADQMTTCVDAFNKAIASLPTDDPVAAQLAGQRDKMISDYGYQPAQTVHVESDRGPQNVSTETDPATMSNPPKDGQWKGTTQGLDNLVQDIKSNAEIDMLKLQDLVSKRQQAVQLASGMMSKEDQTLETQAKAIGQ